MSFHQFQQYQNIHDVQLDSSQKQFDSSQKQFDSIQFVSQSIKNAQQDNIYKHLIRYRTDVKVSQQMDDNTIKKRNFKKYIQNQDDNLILQKNIYSIQKINITKQQETSLSEQHSFDEAENNNFIIDSGLNNQGVEDQNQDNQEYTLNRTIDNLFENQKIKYDYSFNKYKIYKELLKQNYTLVNYLDSGGQADVFDGYFQNDSKKEECVFKIYFEVTSEDFKKEIGIMKSFEKPINIVKIIESLQIDSFFVIIMEKCQYSLKQELMLFKERKLVFSFDKLLQIVFDSLDGLIQFRIYNILHLDIKPGNILISKDGYYCYSDFGNSFNKKKDEQISVKYYTKVYAPPEQIKDDDASIDFKSDVYSLGKTLKKVIEMFKDINKDDLLNQKIQEEIIKNFEKIINEQMILIENSQRKNCKTLHEQFLKQLKVEENLQFYSKYRKKLNHLIGLYEYDQNKDTPYYQQLKLFYSLIQLNLLQNYSNKNICLNCIYKQQSDQESKYTVSSFNHVVNGQMNFSKNQNYLQILEQPEKIEHCNYHNVSSSLNNIGICYMDIGDYKNSLKYLLESYQMSKKIKGHHPDDIKTLINIGNCHMHLNENKKGLKFHIESLEVIKQIYQGNHPDIGKSLDRIGICYMQSGDYQMGFSYLLESLEKRKQMFQGNHFEISVSLGNIGNYYVEQGDYQNGLKYFFESLKMDKQIYQGNHPIIATILANIGVCYQDLGDFQNSLKYLQESIQMMKQIYQKNHPKIVSSLKILANQYKSIGDNQNCLKYLLESFEMIKQSFQENYFNIADILNSLGLFYQDLGQDKTGLKYSLEAIVIAKQSFQGDHPQLALFINNVGTCYMKLGNNQKSLKYQLKSLEMKQQTFQGNHPSIATSLTNIGVIYNYLGDYEQGLKYQIRSIQMLKQIHKGNHPDIATILNNVGVVYVNIGDKQNGLKYLLESLNMKKYIYLKSHPDIASLLLNVGTVYLSFGDRKKCLQYFLKSLIMNKQIYQGYHPQIVETYNYIGIIYQQLGDNKNSKKYLQKFQQQSKLQKY